MFFEGGLQDGLSTARQQAKQIVCFVTDDGDESQQWEKEFLTDDLIRPGLESQSVILRLVAGSAEAGYLEALFPIPKKPTVVVIQNGQLKEYIAAGTSKEEFITRLGKATEMSAAPQAQPAPSSSSSVPATTAAGIPESEHDAPQPSSSNDDFLYDDENDNDIQPTSAPSAPASSSTPAQAVLPPPAPVEEEKQASDPEKGKAKAELDEASRVKPDEKRTSTEQAHAHEVKLRRHQEHEERKRILKRIEDDKLARKEREAMQRRARQSLSANLNNNNTEDSENPIPLSQRVSRPGQGDYCNLQVRLLDGSSIRTRFESDKTIGQDVRNWIDETRTDGDAPYSFRVVLTPLSTRVIKPKEESESLLSLGLAPSATLVLIPTRYSSAYGGGGILSPVIGGFNYIYRAIFGLLEGIFSMIFGGGGGGGGGGRGGGIHPGPRGHENVPMENLRARRDAQLYNGNSLNFEPRNEDIDEDDER
ncbi:hypothetical protein GGR50DRAFT_157273 [Xylaria sp. CBS 124048]|nr:hypothetical protein GGR50DRAFT_157273 [Xylaria sp. CBS 124048]